MRILHITDSHGTAKGPESRKDVYYITFLKKLYELGFVIKKLNVDMVIHTGDLFHTARVSDKFAGQVSAMIKSMGVPFYVVPGNHDIEGYTTDTIDQTKLGLLAKAGVVTILDRDNPIRITATQNGEEFTVAISGQEYYAHIDEGNMRDFEMQQDEADLNILAIHGYIADTPQHPDIKCTMANDIVTDADLILTGHYHRSFEWSDGQNLDIFNPGSMMRVEQTDYNKTHTPQYGILDINLDENGSIEWDYKFHQFRIAQPSTVIFDYASKYKAKAASITLDGFKTSIANTMTAVQPSMTIDKIIGDICTTGKVDAKVEQLAFKMYHDTLQAIPDEFEAQQGYIEAQKTKKISKVILENFQSHAHTEVEFDDGLNIIVGESNNGKTSILRGIMWVIDNQPLGTDFIMAGQDNCYVRIEYNDGTFIERGRTLKDTGYYKVGFIDENGNLTHQMYRGFTNAVPVEVANVHQMPKVNITKDIETHLNVLSQLDAPFLLTESPLVKASAIGRITGTHVVDAAIKEANKTIQGGRKSIKHYEQELTEKENELKALPDIALMTQFTAAYAALVARMKSLNEGIEKIENFIVCNDQYERLIAQDEVRYAQYRVLSNLQNVVSLAETKLTQTKPLHLAYEELQITQMSIGHHQNTLNRTQSLLHFKPIVEQACDLKQSIDQLQSKYDLCVNIEQNLSSFESNANALIEYNRHLNAIHIYCGLLNDYIQRMAPKIIQIADIATKQSAVVDNIAILKRTTKKLDSQVKEAQQQKNAFILDNGICPCCGQKVEESHIPAITSFMEGQ